MEASQEVVLRKGREGGRWMNERPTSESVAEWFRTSVSIDPALKHENYVSGVTLIPAVDTKAKHVTGFTREGLPIIAEREELSFVPYMRVDTRIAYYWDLLDAHPDWVGVVEHVVSPRMSLEFITEEERSGDGESNWREVKRRQPGALSVLVHQLPEGFSIMSVPVGQNYTHFLCCTIRVSIFKADENREPKGRPLRTGRGTKQVPLLTGRSTPWADPNSMMRAETGAHGRALGFAGILVVGSGIATAEDMQDAMAQGAPPAEAAPTNQGPAAPEQAPVRTGAEQTQDDEDALRSRAAALYKTLSEEHPDRATEFGAWAQQRKLQSLGGARGAMLRGVVRKLERLVDEGEQEPQAEEGVDAPAEPGTDAS